jgi:hypothetical protein
MAALIGAVLLVRPDGELVEAPGDDPAR